MRILLPVALALAAAPAVAQVATPSATPATSEGKPTLGQMGLIIYPAKGQTPEQQKADEDACYQWAESQTGLTVGTGSANTDSAAKAAQAQAAEQTQGAAIAGGAKGAAAGAAVGAIAGDAGEGAAIGAIAGVIGGRRAKRQAEAQAGKQGAQNAEHANQKMVDQFKKAASVCLQGRGYTAQ